MNAEIIAIVNQKGGVGKSFSCINIGVGLARAGKKVLLVDFDPQASMTIALGYPQPDRLPTTVTDVMTKIIEDDPLHHAEGIIHHAEGVDLLPADIRLSGMEVALVNTISRETILRQYLNTVKRNYTHILLDCQPSLGMLTVNALAAANRVLIPVQAEYLPAKGLEQLLQTVKKVRKQINPNLSIDGILLTNRGYDVVNNVWSSGYFGKLKEPINREYLAGGGLTEVVMTEDIQADFYTLLTTIPVYSKCDDTIMRIVVEEIPSYLGGIQSEKRTGELIQTKVYLYLNE